MRSFARLDEALSRHAPGGDLCAAGETCLTPLHKAVSGRSHQVAAFLLDRGADVSATSDYGSTPLHTAGQVGADRAMVDLLVQRGGDKVINAVNRFDATALDAAMTNDHPETVEALRAHGASTRCGGG